MSLIGMYSRIFGNENEKDKEYNFKYKDTLKEFNNGIEMTSIFKDIYPTIREVSLVIKGKVALSMPNVEIKVNRVNK